MLHRLWRTPSNSFEFHPLRTYSPGGSLKQLFAWPPNSNRLNSEFDHRLRQWEYQGILILFAPHAFVPQRQLRPLVGCLTLSVFFMVSMHFTATPYIPPYFNRYLKLSSINGSSTVKLRAFTTDLKSRLRTL